MTRRANPIATSAAGVVVLAKCSNPKGCQYQCDPKRNDGLCDWCGALDAYAKTGDRDALWNRGMCGEDALGPRMGQLCGLTHHAECQVGRDLRSRAAARDAVQRKLTPHQQIVGGDERGA